ncbi:hypothetical protein GYH30_022925 [Glycine max]|nr:hypothetical protein GYH30_022925 [Glycine max]
MPHTSNGKVTLPDDDDIHTHDNGDGASLTGPRAQCIGAGHCELLVVIAGIVSFVVVGNNVISKNDVSFLHRFRKFVLFFFFNET